MSRAVIQPSQLKGRISLPPSKSDTHRAVICASLACGVSRVEPVELSDDIKATCSACRALGARLEYEEDTLIIDGSHMFETKTAALNCCESGSTLRFLMPVAAAGGVKAEFIGCGRLPRRPIGEIIAPLAKQGVAFDGNALPLTLSGRLRPGRFSVPGNVSSQIITGLLFALPILDGDSEILLTTALESSGYVDMTLRTLETFGIHVQQTSDGYLIKGNQHYAPCDYETEGDWSQSAFFFTGGALSGDITVDNLNPRSAQGDRQAAALYRAFGADITHEGGLYRIKAAPLKGIDIDASGIPDLVPALAITAAFAQGITTIHSAARLRFKESDRIACTCAGLRALGVQVQETPDSMIISGGVSPGEKIIIKGCNDHRIVMAFAAAACGLDRIIEITDTQAVQKSYPGFFDDFNKLGGICHVLDNG